MNSPAPYLVHLPNNYLCWFRTVIDCWWMFGEVFCIYHVKLTDYFLAFAGTLWTRGESWTNFGWERYILWFSWINITQLLISFMTSSFTSKLLFASQKLECGCIWGKTYLSRKLIFFEFYGREIYGLDRYSMSGALLDADGWWGSPVQIKFYWILTN